MFDFNNQTIRLMKNTTLLSIVFLFFSIINAQPTIQGSVSDRIDPLLWANIYIKN